ncbi:MAG: FkbM family methyltransferase [Rhodomicrobium sp.]
MQFGYYRNIQLLNVLAHDERVPDLVRKVLRSTFRGRIADVELDGVRFRCCPNQNHHDLAIARGTLFTDEKDEYDFLQRHLRKGDVLVDLGANIGAICIPTALRTGARVLAIEPNPVNAGRLRYNAQINGLPDFTIAPYAAGPAGFARLWLNRPSNSGTASMHKKKKKSGYIDIECRPLLQILEESRITHITAMKIDIEGFEDRALGPFFKDAPEKLWPEAVIIEHSHQTLWQEDIVEAMKALGYRQAGKTNVNTYLDRGAADTSRQRF